MIKTFLAAVAALTVATTAHAGLRCDVLNSKTFYEVTGDLILKHLAKGDGQGTMVVQTWRCNKSATRPDGETQCAAESMDFDAYSAIKILPDEGLALISWGNLSLDNHVVTHRQIECRNY